MYMEEYLDYIGDDVMSVDDLLSTLADIVSKMRTVKFDDYVESTDTNLFMEYCETALQLLQSLYQQYKDKTGKTIQKVEEMINLATNRITYARKVRYGDIPLPSDHNVVVDTLKAIEIGLIELEKNL
jgi:N-glycosylase/DNA lyase